MRIRELPSFLSFQNSSDGALQALVLIGAVALLIHTGTGFETEYPRPLIDLYVHPWWRMLVVLLLIAAASWCPRVAVVVALVVFFYLSDMNTLIAPVTNLTA